MDASGLKYIDRPGPGPEVKGFGDPGLPGRRNHAFQVDHAKIHLPPEGQRVPPDVSGTRGRVGQHVSVDQPTQHDVACQPDADHLWKIVRRRAVHTAGAGNVP